MKNLFATLALCLFMLSSCTADLDKLSNRLDDLEDRVAILEELCAQMNTNVESLQTIIDALQNNDFITSIEPIVEGGDTIGYRITFSESGQITIYHGEDGKDGLDGEDGRDGNTPEIGIAQYTDGKYYWTIDGQWMLDDNGEKIPVTGEDGEDAITPRLKIEDGYWFISYDGGLTWTRLGEATGEDGKDGQDGSTPEIGVKADTDGVYYWTLNGEWLLDDNGEKIPVQGESGTTPQLKIEDDYWYISYDGGLTWTQLGKATGDDGRDGNDGLNGDSIFEDVYEKDGCVYFVLSNGNTIVIPIMDGGGTITPDPEKDFDITFTYEPGTEVAVGESVEIAYTVKGADKYTKVKATLEDGDDSWTAIVTPDAEAENEGTGVITVTNVSAEDQTGVIMVFAYNGDGNTIEKAIILEGVPAPEPVLTVTSTSPIEFTADGGEGTIIYTVENPRDNATMTATVNQEAAGWISSFTYADGKVTFTASANPDETERTATITLTYAYGENENATATVTVNQEGLVVTPTYDHELVLESGKAGGMYYGNAMGGDMIYVLHFNPRAFNGVYTGYHPNSQYYVITLQAPAPADLENIVLPAGNYTAEQSDPTGVIDGDMKILKINNSTLNIKKDLYTTSFYEGGGDMVDDYLDYGTLSVSYEGGNYTIEGIFTDIDGETHHLTYTGPLPISNEVEESTPALSTLTGDVNADVDCDGFIYNRIVGDTRQIKLQTATTGVAYDTFFTIVASVSSDETSLYTGNFTINDSGKAYYAVAGYIDEATGKKEGCWVECSDGTYAPLVSGSLQVNMTSGTITINAQDDANHTITGSITGMLGAWDTAGMGMDNVWEPLW